MPKYVTQKACKKCLFWVSFLLSASIQEPSNYEGNRFRMVVKKDQRGEFVREVTFDQDFGAVYKLKKGTRRQYERGYVDAKVKRGTPSGW